MGDYVTRPAPRAGDRSRWAAHVAFALKDGNGAAVSGATVAATWTLPSGTTQTQTAATDTGGNANFSTRSVRGTYKLTVNNISKTGYTFDAANSVLTKSITK
jgi:hypothetical protein